MLKKRFKNYIEEAVRDQYKRIDNNPNNILILREKINNFDRFLDVYSKNNKYSKDIENFYLDLENAVLDEGKISSKTSNFLNTILEILFDVKTHAKLDSTGNKIAEEATFLNNMQILKDLNIITDNKSLQDLKLQFEKWEEGEKLNINTYWNYVSSIFIIFLELTNRMKENIMEQYIFVSLNLQEYIQNIIKSYESKINFKYIPSSVLKVNNFNLEDNTSIEDDNSEVFRFIDVNQDERYKKIKLIGYAGVGKTTTLEYIEYQDALHFEKNQKIPVIINLITVNEFETIEKLICKKLNIETENDEVTKFLLKKNRINLYLDGINEISISKKDERRDFVNMMEDFINKKEHKELKVIVTDRDNDDVSVLNNSYTFLIQGMNENDINEFIEGNSEKNKIDEIKHAITQNDEIYEAVTHPFMLKKIITIIECGKQIPKDIEELSTVYLNSIIEREQEEKHEKYAKYINNLLKYYVKKITEKETDIANPPISHFELIPIFYDFADKNNIENFNADNMLDLLLKMGILREADFEKYVFSDERFFQKYYNDIIEEIDL